MDSTERLFCMLEELSIRHNLPLKIENKKISLGNCYYHHPSLSWSNLLELAVLHLARACTIDELNKDKKV